MESGDKDGKGMDMVNTDTELILQHPSPLITHAHQSLLPLLLVGSIHIIEYPTTHKEYEKNPTTQQLWEPIPADQCVLPLTAQLLTQPHSHCVVVVTLAMNLLTHQH